MGEEGEEGEGEEARRIGVEERGGGDAEDSNHDRLYITTVYNAFPVFGVKLDCDSNMFSSIEYESKLLFNLEKTCFPLPMYFFFHL